MHFIKNILCTGLLTGLCISAQAQVGNPAPNFTVTDTHGDTHTLYDYLDSGKVVVLDFYYTTCGPCQFYAPQVNLAYQKYGCNTAEVVFMAIDYQDTDLEVIAYDQQYGIEYPSVSGLQGGGNAVVGLYNIVGFPTFYVIDHSKTIVQAIDPPTLQVFDFRFGQLGIQPADCLVSATGEAAATEQIQIFPNPLQADRLYVTLPENAAGWDRYDLVDCTGRTVRQGQVPPNSHGATELETGDLPAGVFFLKITDRQGGRTLVGRLAKH